MHSRASEKGAVAPASLLAAAVVAVAIGTAGYALTSGPTETPQTPAPAAHTQPPAVKAKPKARPTATNTPALPPVNRASYNVAIYNNSNIVGLARRTSTKAQTLGWQVVTTSQWFGTVDTSTVYYPAKMQAAAKQLATDLGITTIRPAVSPMQMNQLTVILTVTYGG